MLQMVILQGLEDNWNSGKVELTLISMGVPIHVYATWNQNAFSVTYSDVCYQRKWKIAVGNSMDREYLFQIETRKELLCRY